MRGLPIRATVLLLCLAVLLACPLGAAAEKGKENKPARAFVAALKYPEIWVAPGEKVRVDIMLHNKGRSDETVLFKLKQVPQGWKADIRNFGTVIGGMFLSEDRETSVELVAEPKDKGRVKPGDYRFVVEARSADGAIRHTSTLVVHVSAKEKASREIELETSYPVLKGPTDARFEFSLEVRNNSAKEKLFNLSAQGPPGWDISFKPAYEQKQISSLHIKGDQSSSLSVEITPARDAGIGTYPIKVKVSSATASAETELKVVLTGTYRIKAGTPTGLLSLSTQAGQPANISFYVRNDGSAPQREITFLSFKPENWKVEFKPEKIVNLKPGALKQVEMTITPAERALVGDYSVAVTAQGEKARSNLEFRVTVKASAAWGWIGVGIIILVLVGLGVVFRKLGRR